jgi:hypothetical protein
MIIKEKYAKELIRRGKARRVGYVAKNHTMGHYYAIVERIDLNRTDHYYIRGNSREYLAWEVPE